MSASLDRECPSCHKRFDSDTLVLRHMNNPWTSCATWHDFLESISLEQPPDNEATNDNNDDPTNHHTFMPMRYEDVHPNHPSIFGSGPGFMDIFNSDPSAEKRGVNIYYPFSSKEEWSLASWLLCSGLSMRAINDFLALPIVSLEVRTITASLIRNNRSGNFRSPSQLQKHSGPGWTTFQKPQNGRCKTLPSKIAKPQNRLYCSTETH